MKSETTFHYSNFPLKIVGENKQETGKPPLLHIVEQTASKKHRFGIIENEAIQDSVNWDTSWFANYE